MKNILKFINVRALIYAFLIWLNLNITGIQNLYFSEGNLSTIIIVKILHLLFLYGIFAKIHSLLSQRHDKKVKQEIIISLIYLLILSVLLIGVWPGTWSSDDISVLKNAESYVFTPWQHFFSGLFQILCLQTIPIPSGVIIIQIIIASLIAGYCISNISNLYGKTKKQENILKIVLGLILLLPPVVIYILSGFRMGLYSYLELALITKLIVLYKEKKKITISDILNISFLTVIISCWRTEGLYYPVFILILFLFLGKKLIRKKVAIITFILIMITNLSVGKLNNYLIKTNDYVHNPKMKYSFYNHPTMKANNYSITATMEPVTQLIKASDESDKNEIETINKVVDVEYILENPEKSGENNFWTEGVVRDYSDEEYYEYLKAYLKLAIKYPDVTFKSMWNIFEKAGSGMGYKDRQITRNMVSGRDTLRLFEIGSSSWRRWSAVTSKVLKYKGPINLELRNKVICVMNGTDANLNLNIIHNIFWNFFIPFALILICLINKLIKKEWFMVFLILAIGARIPLVFVTAPAPYFMYYLSTYLCSYVVSAIFIFEMILSHRENKGEKIFNAKTFLYTFLIWFNLNILEIQNIYFTDKKSLMMMVVKVLHFLFLYLIIDKIRALYKNRYIPKVKNEIIISITYFLILMTLLILVWPGIWNVGDITILRNASTFELAQGENIFSGIFQMLCLQTIPIPSGVIIIQAIIASLIVGYCISNISRLYGKNQKQVIILQIVLGLITLLPPFIAYILSGSSMGIYCCLQLALVTEILILCKKQTKASLLDLLKISFLIMVVWGWGVKGTNDFSDTLNLYTVNTKEWVKWNSVPSKVAKYKMPINLEIRNKVIKLLDINNLNICFKYISNYLYIYIIVFLIVRKFIIKFKNRKHFDNDDNKTQLVVYKGIFKQFLRFLLVSGIGWIIDFIVYLVLTNVADFKVVFANILSSIPAITYVFLMSNKKIFKKVNSKLSIKVKYLIYFGYQLILLLSISLFGEFLYNKLINLVTLEILVTNLKLFIKILITPITMTLNFIVMKNLIEKI